MKKEYSIYVEAYGTHITTEKACEKSFKTPEDALGWIEKHAEKGKKYEIKEFYQKI